MYHWSVTSVVAFALLSVVPVVAGDPAQGDPEKRARELLQLLVDEKYDEFVAAADKTMQAAFSSAQAGQMWGLFCFQLGDYQTVESATTTHKDNHDSVSLVLRFARGTVTLRIVLNEAGELAGLWSDQITPAIAYEPPSYVHKDAFREVEVTVSAGQFALPGTLTVPTGDGTFPGVVLVHGSGAHDRDETVAAQKPFRDLAWGLASRGIAVLRYEKRTKAHPRACKADEWTLETETIDDAVAAAALLRTRPEIDPQRVFVVGHSLGGIAAPYIAQRDNKLAGIVVLAGAGRSVVDLIEEQVEYLVHLDGTVTPEEQQAIDQTKQTAAAVRSGHLDEAPTDGALPAKYLADLHARRPAEVAAKLKLPILVVQGGRDYQVTRADFAVWEQNLRDRPQATLKLLPDLNHLFNAGDGSTSDPAEYQKPGHVDERVVTLLADWLTHVGR
ncbi:MAG: alpha/beta fold hydrolase [Phycisphaerae bacterium]|jgi:dienelactone hydrolase